jgi:hypothetical protein
VGGFGAFPSMSAVPEDAEMSLLSGGMMGLGLSNPFAAVSSRARKGKGGKDNVLCCIRFVIFPSFLP